MSKVVKMVAMALVFTVILTLGISGAAFASSADGPPGPAPESGDGIAEGADGPNGYGPGPAPNSGDGVPDGPGW